MYWCDACGVGVPNQAGTVKQHNEGKRHASMRFYGRADAGPVHRIEVRAPGGELLETLRPHEVDGATATASRDARELVRRKLLVHTGVAFQNQAWGVLTPEALCTAVLQLEAAIYGPREGSEEDGPTYKTMLEGHCGVSAHFLLAVAERLDGGAGAAGSSGCVGGGAQPRGGHGSHGRGGASRANDHHLREVSCACLVVSSAGPG